MDFLISFSPVGMTGDLTVERRGGALCVNGDWFDFSGLEEGSTYPKSGVPCPALVSDIEVAGGVVRLTLVLPHAAGAPEHMTFATPVLVTSDGLADIPQNDRFTHAETAVDGGKLYLVTRHRWKQPDAVVIEQFIQSQEATDVEA